MSAPDQDEDVNIDDKGPLEEEWRRQLMGRKYVEHEDEVFDDLMVAFYFCRLFLMASTREQSYVIVLYNNTNSGSSTNLCPCGRRSAYANSTYRMKLSGSSRPTTYVLRISCHSTSLPVSTHRDSGIKMCYVTNPPLSAVLYSFECWPSLWR